MRRKGMMVGSGRRGYHNIIGKDPMVHSDSARGMKQPQRMTIVPRYRKGKDAPVTEINEGFLSKVAEKQEQKPSKVVSALSKAGSRAYAFGSARYKQLAALQRKRATERKERYIEELRDIDHPIIKKRDKLEAEIEALEQKVAAGVGDEDKHFENIEVLQEKLKEVEGQIEHLDLSTFTDPQLKALAVREKGDDNFLSLSSSNKYESELLRRIAYRKELDKKMRDAATQKKEDSGGLFDI